MAKAPPPMDEKTLRISIARIERCWTDLRASPLLGPLVQRAKLRVLESPPQNPQMFTCVNAGGEVFANPYNHPRSPGEWTFALAHALLHLAFGHLRLAGRGIQWNIACDCMVNDFLGRMRIGTQPEHWLRLPPGMPNSEEKLFTLFKQGTEVPKGQTANGNAMDLLPGGQAKANWADIFARAIRKAARASLAAASDDEDLRPAQQARAWLVKNYPFLGAVLQHLRLVENAKLCERLGVRIAAVNPRQREILLNPGWAMEDRELRFVLAHMALHCGLQHEKRRRGRDPFLWNAACDYCINSYLSRIALITQTAQPPTEGHLLSAEYQDLGPEEIYERLLRNEKVARKLVTFAGESVCDLLTNSDPNAEGERPGDDDRLLLDALLRGYRIHTEAGRGALPAKLLDEMRALEHPPLPWDVQLARWFDEHIPPVERVRTYGRPSRRQAATPEIARPRYVWPDDETAQRSTFGLVVDVSGALSRERLAVALSAISMYALSRGVRYVRAVYCGGEVQDRGLLVAEELNAAVKFSERSAPLLQPGLDALAADRNFAPEAPVLLLTGMPCDRVKTERDHAFLIPDGARLPFQSAAPVLELPEE